MVHATNPSTGSHHILCKLLEQQQRTEYHGNRDRKKQKQIKMALFCVSDAFRIKTEEIQKFHNFFKFSKIGVSAYKQSF